MPHLMYGDENVLYYVLDGIRVNAVTQRESSQIGGRALEQTPVRFLIAGLRARRQDRPVG